MPRKKTKEKHTGKRVSSHCFCGDPMSSPSVYGYRRVDEPPPESLAEPLPVPTPTQVAGYTPPPLHSCEENLRMGSSVSLYSRGLGIRRVTTSSSSKESGMYSLNGSQFSSSKHTIVQMQYDCGPLKYPKSVGFIISNEFCERFNYYGMRTILVLYLTTKLHYDKDTSTVLFHIFTMLVYLCPLMGAIVADSWLGKYKTIMYLSIVYVFGGIIIAIGAVPTLDLPVKPATIIGLILIAIGTGGIKPCVSAFGGDQFRLPEQAKQLATFFSLFYFAINAGSTISTTITPILRQDVHCFGDKDCFSLAFGVPAVLMLLSVLILAAGKRMYVMKPPAGNMLLGVTKCITDAISSWRRERKTNPRKHWLDYAEHSSGQKMVSDTKILMRILVLYLPFPVFWALFDQQGSRWTFQATRMDGDIMGYTVKPDQMQVVNPLLILVFIPLFDYVIYPLLSKIGIRRPLQKLTLGGLLAAAAFILSAFVELKLEAEQPLMPDEMGAHMRIYNAMPCRYRFTTDVPTYTTNLIEPLAVWEEKQLVVPQEMHFSFNATSERQICPNLSSTIRLMPGAATSFLLADGKMLEFEDSAEKSKLGNPLVRVLMSIPAYDGMVTLTDPADVATDLETYNASQVVNVVKGESIVTVSGKRVASLSTRNGGVYALIIMGNHDNGYEYKSHVITEPNTVHMMWQLPQIIVITAAEIMFSVTGLEFSFTQAPQSMKSVLQACWLLSVAIGNMLVVVIAELKFFESQAAEFFLFAGLMIVDMMIFMLIALRYKYVEHDDDQETGNTVITPATTTLPSQSNGAGKASIQGYGENPSLSHHGHANEAFVEER